MLPFTHANKRTRARKQGNTQLNEMHIFLAHTYTHTPSAADSRALSPITTEQGSAAWWEQTIWGICQVLVDSKQSTVKNALPWLGTLLPAPLCSACGGRYSPPSPRRNLSSSFHIVLFFCAYRLLQTPRVLPPSERLLQICLRGLRGGHDTLETESIHITHCGRSQVAGQGWVRGREWERKTGRTGRSKIKRKCLLLYVKKDLGLGEISLE